MQYLYSLEKLSEISRFQADTELNLSLEAIKSHFAPPESTWHVTFEITAPAEGALIEDHSIGVPPDKWVWEKFKLGDLDEYKPRFISSHQIEKGTK